MSLETANLKVKNLKNRFTWESDGRLDSWHLLPKHGKVKGDCDDFAYTALLEVSGGLFKAWFWLLTFQACFFHVKSERGNPHIVLWVWKYGWTDNYKDSFTNSVSPHSRPIPCPWPFVVLKLFIGMFDKT